jgi:hypothetical protein
MVFDTTKGIDSQLPKLLKLRAKFECLYKYKYHNLIIIKGTVPRDFSPQLFFMKHISLGP